jgi:hypothetical protein
MPGDLTTIFKLRPDVVVTALEREAVMLDLTTKYFYSLNPSAWALTQLFEGGATRESAVSRAIEWGANGDLPLVNAFIDKLASENLITPSGDSTFETNVSYTGAWAAPTVEKHKEPLQRVMISAFDPTLPLAE